MSKSDFFSRRIAIMSDLGDIAMISMFEEIKELGLIRFVVMIVEPVQGSPLGCFLGVLKESWLM